MRSLLQFLALSAVIALCVCYESYESTESEEDLFVPPHQANLFMTPQRGNSRNNLNLRRTVKSTAERRAEICEDHSPCRFYAYRYGFVQAYQRYFGSRTQPQQRPAAVTRLY